MKKTKILALGLSALFLATSINSTAFANFSDVVINSNEENGDDEQIVAYREKSEEKNTYYMKIYKKSGFKLEETKEIGTLDKSKHEGSNPNYLYKYFSDILNSQFNSALIQVMQKENDSDNRYCITAYRVGKLIITNIATGEIIERYYTVTTPKESQPQKVSYTLENLGDTGFYTTDIEGNNRIRDEELTKTLTSDNNLVNSSSDSEESEANTDEDEEEKDPRYKNTYVYKWASGEHGLASEITPTINDVIKYKGESFDFSDINNAIQFTEGQKSKISRIEPINSDSYPTEVGEYSIKAKIYYIDKSSKTYEVKVIIKNEARPQDNSQVNPDNNGSNNSNPNTGGSSAGGSSSGASSAGGSSSGGSSSGGSSSGGSSSGGSSAGGSSAGGSSAGGSGRIKASGGAGISNKNVQNTNIPSYVVSNGHWNNNNGKWQYKSNKEFKNQWVAIKNPYAKQNQESFSWFKFDKDGNMLTGWIKDDNGKWYYLNSISDGTLGAMLTSWQWIKDPVDGKEKCYYFNPNTDGTRGMLLTNTTTKDGYQVNEKGEWVVSGKVQTR